MKIQNKFFPFLFILAFCLFVGTPLHAKTPPVEVEIKGVNEKMEENIRSNLSILQEPEEWITDSARMELYTKRVPPEVSFALQPFGYYGPHVDTAISQKQEIWNVDINVQLNDPVRITGIQFQILGEGKDDFRLRTLRSQFPLNEGDILDHDSYEQGKKALLSKAIQAGYLNAYFSEHRIEVNTDTLSSDIFLTLTTGIRHYFGPLTFESSVLSDKFLRRFVPFQPGDVYAPEKVLMLQSQLSQSNYFSRVNVRSVNEENSDKVPVVVELEDAKPNQYMIGAGYGTDTGIRGKVGWTRRRLNSMGHRFSAQARVAEIYNKVELDYSIPGKRPNTDQIKFKAGFFEDEYDQQPSQIYEAQVLEEREIVGWQRRIALSYQHEKFNAFITNEKVQTRLVLPSITFIQTKRDDLAAPTHGRRIEISLRGSVDALISDTSFFQTYLQVRWLHAFSPTLKTLIRTEFGFTLPDDAEKLPLSQRFFAGGDLSLRGFGYRTLPYEIDKDGNRHPVGGTYLGIASVELVKSIKKPFGVFTFLDAGNAFRRLAEDEIQLGTGVGIEWQTRVGPIKFAIAKPLTKSADSWRIHASFGPEI